MNIELIKPPQFSKPSLFDILREVRAPFEFASVALHFHALRQAPRGNGRAVLLVPGYLADDHSMRPLGAYLKYLNYDVYYTELGRNMGKVNTDMMRLGDRVESVSQSVGGEKVSLIGWSLGGVYARDLALRMPDMVRYVVTLGSPFAGDITATNAKRVYEMVSGETIQDADIKDIQALSGDLPVPTSSLYTRTDGIVNWQTCLVNESDAAENIEITLASHIGIGVNAAALWAVADRLAQPEGQFHPFDRSGPFALAYARPEKVRI